MVITHKIYVSKGDQRNQSVAERNLKKRENGINTAHQSVIAYLTRSQGS